MKITDKMIDAGLQAGLNKVNDINGRRREPIAITKAHRPEFYRIQRLIAEAVIVAAVNAGKPKRRKVSEKMR